MNWISVKDNLPQKGQVVLIFETSEQVPIPAIYKDRFHDWNEICNCHCGDGEGSNFYQGEVTHWMTLPESPKE